MEVTGGNVLFNFLYYVYRSIIELLLLVVVLYNYVSSISCISCNKSLYAAYTKGDEIKQNMSCFWHPEYIDSLKASNLCLLTL